MLSIQYQVTLANPAAHLFHVTCLIQNPDTKGQSFSLPAWIPGSYLIRDFAKNIISLKASSEGKLLQLQRLDKESWQCEPCQGVLQLEYEVYAWDESVRTAQLDFEYGFFNGTSMFLRVHSQEGGPCGLTLLPPEDISFERWQVTTAMPIVKVDANGFGEYSAANYDELIDHPVAMGECIIGNFNAAGVPHIIALFGQHHADMDRLCSDLTKICEQHIYFFDEHAPVEAYLFLVRVVGEGYGGLEHRASTALICSRDSLPSVNDEKMTDEYREFLGLCSHEYFHTWNIKRIKPLAFAPYDLQKENYTELLWAFEGITSYYDDLALLRCGLIDGRSYLELVARTITRVSRCKGRLKQTLAESSFYAWTKFYQQDENAINAIVSYYAKGALVALCLDLLIRKNTQNKKSLDDVMRLLWARYGATDKGVPEHAVEAIACEVGGESLASFFEQAVRSTQNLPLAELLNEMGVSLNLRAAESAADKGGKPASAQPMKVELGANLMETNGVLKVVSVVEGLAAQQAGLSAGDMIVACNGFKASEKRLQAELFNLQVRDRLQLHLFRRDELYAIDVILQAPELTTCYLEINQQIDEVTQSLFDGWLKLNQ